MKQHHNAGKELNSLRPRVEKQCSKCGSVFMAYQNGSGELCRRCYNAEYQRNRRAKLK